MTEQEKLDAFLLRAGFTYGWRELESQARRMAEQAVEELDTLTARLAEALSHEGEKDAQIEQLLEYLRYDSATQSHPDWVARAVAAEARLAEAERALRGIGWSPDAQGKWASRDSAEPERATVSADDGYCESCDGDRCTAGPKCVATSNPPLPLQVKCARCGLDGTSETFIVEEGDEWECPSCWERCVAAGSALVGQGESK